MGNRVISPVNNLQDKYETYRSLMGRYNQAIKYHFYFEAMLIDYALLEDRFRSWLYHIGVIPNRESTKVSSIAKKELSSIIEKYKTDKEKSGLGYSNISSKIKIIRSLLNWAQETESDYKNSKYLTALKSQLEAADIQEMLEVITMIETWKGYRNEIVHALMNKNLSSVNEQLAEQALLGKQYSDILAKNLRRFQKGDKVRKAANLPMN